MSEESQVTTLGVVSVVLALAAALFVFAPKVVGLAVLGGLLAFTALCVAGQQRRIDDLEDDVHQIEAQAREVAMQYGKSLRQDSNRAMADRLRADESMVLEQIAADTNTDVVLESIVSLLARQFPGSSFRMINDELFSPEEVGNSYTILPRTDIDTGWVLQANFDVGVVDPDVTVLELAIDLAKLALDKHRSRSNLRYQADHDALTGLLSRRAVLAALDRAIATNHSIGLVYCDIDEFKEINDTLGHQAGDDLLTGISNRLNEAATEAPFDCQVGRLGGDEYLIVTSQSTRNQMVDFVEQLSFAIRVPFVIQGSSLSTSLSLGVTHVDATMPGQEPPNSAQLLKESDLALYQVKRSGRDGYRLFDDELRTILAEQRSLQEDLASSINAHSGIHAMFQPQLNASRELVGFEALGRWYRQGEGLVNPEQFLGVAAEHGLLASFDHEVFKHTVQTLARIRREGQPFGTVAINVSAERLESPNFVKSTLHILRKHAIDPQSIVLEITESSLLRDLHERGRRLEQLRKWGVRIAIDDFGTGYSSLSYLRELPVDIVKLDKDFVSDVDTSEESRAIVKAILALATALELEVVAEGVERETQYELLRDLGCQTFQGFLLGYPLELAAATDLASQQWEPDLFSSAFEWSDGPPKDLSSMEADAEVGAGSVARLD